MVTKVGFLEGEWTIDGNGDNVPSVPIIATPIAGILFQVWLKSAMPLAAFASQYSLMHDLRCT